MSTCGIRKISRLCLTSRCVIIPKASSGTLHGEVDRKAGFNHRTKRPVKEHVVEGLKILKKDIKKYKDQITTANRWENPRMFSQNFDHGDFEYFWKFNGTDSLDDWVVTTDRDNLGGFSKAKLSLSKSNKALFQGYISTRVPKNGVLTNAGYANLRSPLNYKYFGKVEPYNWDFFTHLVFRVRGDGRPYNINIHMQREYDTMWFDMYHFTLFTRGGPYWQIAKIPFSKFFLSCKGRIQDAQMPLVNQLNQVRSLGLTLQDTVDGPFQLEIDYIALIHDKNHDEGFAYEMYKAPKVAV